MAREATIRCVGLIAASGTHCLPRAFLEPVALRPRTVPMICKRTLAFCCAAWIILSSIAVSHGQSRPPKLVPPGWSTEAVQGRKDVIRYVSPDHQAVLTLRDRPRDGRTVTEEFATFSGRSNERITYKRLSDSWFVVSGYRGDDIFYTRVDLACRGHRWHVAELTYPRAKKTNMDAQVTHVSNTLRKYRNACPARE